MDWAADCKSFEVMTAVLGKDNRIWMTNKGHEVITGHHLNPEKTAEKMSI